MSKFAQEIVLTTILIILSIFLFYYGTNYPSDELTAGGGPTFFAKIVLIILSISCLLNIANIIKERSNFYKAKEDDSTFNVKSIILLAVIGGYLFCIPQMGFVFATFIFTYVGYFLIIDDVSKAWKRKYILAIYYLAASLLLHFIFVKVLKVVLPQGSGVFREITSIF